MCDIMLIKPTVGWVKLLDNLHYNMAVYKIILF